MIPLMTSYTNNRLISFRARLQCLDEPGHRLVWEGQPPAIFGNKVGLIRTQLAALIADTTAQSTPITGTAAQKEAAETALENAAHALGRMVVLYAHDHQNEVLAHKFDVPLGHWRKLRDEPLLERARLLAEEAAALIAQDPTGALDYSITPGALAPYQAKVDAFAATIVAPHQSIAHRSVLTASIPEQVRALSRLFENIEDILPQFTTPAGLAFAAAYRSSAPIINRGHRYETPDDDIPESETGTGTSATPPGPADPSPA